MVTGWAYGTPSHVNACQNEFSTNQSCNSANLSHSSLSNSSFHIHQLPFHVPHIVMHHTGLHYYPNRPLSCHMIFTPSFSYIFSIILLMPHEHLTFITFINFLFLNSIHSHHTPYSQPYVTLAHHFLGQAASSAPTVQIGVIWSRNSFVHIFSQDHKALVIDPVVTSRPSGGRWCVDVGMGKAAWPNFVAHLFCFLVCLKLSTLCSPSLCSVLGRKYYYCYYNYQYC